MAHDSNHGHVYCDDLSPDERTRCGLGADHVGVHENWYGTWFGGTWITHMVQGR